jgi:hypothetical protein
MPANRFARLFMRPPSRAWRVSRHSESWGMVSTLRTSVGSAARQCRAPIPSALPSFQCRRACRRRDGTEAVGVPLLIPFDAGAGVRDQRIESYLPVPFGFPSGLA